MSSTRWSPRQIHFLDRVSPISFNATVWTGVSILILDAISPLKNIVLKTSLNIGLLETQDQTLIFENYFLGGFNTIRGYFIRSIGPVARVGGLDPDAPLVDFNMGGNKQIISNTELEFLISTASRHQRGSLP